MSRPGTQVLLCHLQNGKSWSIWKLMVWMVLDNNIQSDKNRKANLTSQVTSTWSVFRVSWNDCILFIKLRLRSQFYINPLIASVASQQINLLVSIWGQQWQLMVNALSPSKSLPVQSHQQKQKKKSVKYNQSYQ